MITDWLLDIGLGLVQFVLDWIPVVTPPEWMTSAAGFTGQVFGFAQSMGVWFPWALAGTVLAAVLLFWLVGFGIKLVRMILSLFTAGGGSAA